MKIICSCGAITHLITDEDGERYTEGEGWYKVAEGPIEINESHDQVFFQCRKCGEEIWIFT